MLVAELDLELKVLVTTSVLAVNLMAVVEPAEFDVNLMAPRVRLKWGINLGANLTVMGSLGELPVGMIVLYLLESQG